MSILVDFNNVPQRLLDFEARSYDERYNQSPLIRGLAYTLIALEWEGTPSILSDAFIPKPKDSDSFIATIERLGYRCDVTKLKTLEHIEGHPHPCFIEIENLTAIFLGTKDGKLILFDYTNNNTIEYPLCKKPCLLVSISEYSRLFREPPPESQDRSNWIKYAFYRYNNELKSLIILSFVISILGALQPFFIMSVYNFALTSSSQATLYWLTLFAVIVGFSEYFFKKMRVNIIATSGKDLAVHISQAVISKLLWLPLCDDIHRRRVFSVGAFKRHRHIPPIGNGRVNLELLRHAICYSVHCRDCHHVRNRCIGRHGGFDSDVGVLCLLSLHLLASHV